MSAHLLMVLTAWFLWGWAEPNPPRAEPQLQPVARYGDRYIGREIAPTTKKTKIHTYEAYSNRTH